MGNINQEWKELRMKNGNFINHIDGEIAKIEKEKRLLDEQKEQLQNPTDAVAFTMQFVAPPPFNCCQDDRDILKALNKAQADRIEILEKELIARKEQQQIDLAVKKDLDEKLDKATAEYRALWVKNEDLKSQLAGAKAQCENTVENRQRISELSQEVIDLREENVDLQKQLYAAKKETDDFIAMYDKAAAEAHQANVAKDRMGYSNSCMQSKIAKQANEIKRLTEENEKLRDHHAKMSNMIDKLNDDASKKEILYHNLWLEKKSLKEALDIAAKDAEGNFDRGYHRGMDELWDAIREAQEKRPRVLTDIYGQDCMYDCVSNLSAQDFAKKTMEWEEKQAKDIQLGDEVEIFDTFCPDDDQHSDVGIVIAVDSDGHSFAVIGPNFEGCFDETDIQSGNVRKTGQHFESIPLTYLA